MQEKKIILMSEAENRLRKIVVDLHWMAHRYADGRGSYVTSLFNEHTQALLSLGVKLNPTLDEIVWARDRGGRDYDHLSDEMATPGTFAAKGISTKCEVRAKEDAGGEECCHSLVGLHNICMACGEDAGDSDVI